MKGIGTDVDHSKAYNYFKLAAELKDSGGQTNLGFAFAGNDPDVDVLTLVRAILNKMLRSTSFAAEP